LNLRLRVNGREVSLEVSSGETVLEVARRLGMRSVKKSCETGNCGACTVLLDGRPVASCIMLAAQAEGREVTTLEGLAGDPLAEALQRAFVEAGAPQCGYCTPGMLLTLWSFLRVNPKPSRRAIREAIAGNLCRCSGYVKIVDAVEMAAGSGTARPAALGAPAADRDTFRVVTKSHRKLDGEAIVKGEARYTTDMLPEGALYAKVLRSPHAHARIKGIRTDKALAVPGVRMVLTHQNVPRIAYTTAGQNFPEPSPYDAFMLDDKVRFVGDRVAVVVADDETAAERGSAALEVDYEVLPAVFDPAEALRPGAPVLHDETDADGILDASRNLVARVEVEVGDVDAGFKQADRVYENTYSVHYVQHVPMEPHVAFAYLDEARRVVIVSATQVPFHVRRIVARVNEIPISRIRVIKPRIGGGFGGKQEVVLEDLCAHIALKTGRSVFMELKRDEEFFASRTRHPEQLTVKTGLTRDGRIVANEMRVLANTGAYGAHGLTVPSNTGSKTLPLYKSPNLRFVADVAYTNLPVAGAMRGYGAPQGYFALESHMDEIARAMGLDPMALRRRNLIRQGDTDPIATKLGEGKAGFKRVVRSCGLDKCIELAARAMGEAPAASAGKWRGRGFAVCMHGSGIAGDDLAGATIKANEDGSFNLLIGATDLGTGSDTILAQMAAEVLGVGLEDMIVYSSDTDYTPFDVGAYASSTTYVSGTAVVKAAEQVRERLRAVAAGLVGEDARNLTFEAGVFSSPGGKRVHVKEAALKSFYGEDKQQITETASFLTLDSPPPFAACFADVEVDPETGVVAVTDIACAVDLGRAINPTLAEAQIIGSVSMGVGYALSEEMLFSPRGKMLNASLMEYKIPTSLDLPDIKAIMVESPEPSGPFGAKSVGEICLDVVAPAIANAIHNGAGIRLRHLPFTSEKVWRALREAGR
jgi:putative selenate reductase molybdopterin-binding subunit